MGQASAREYGPTDFLLVLMGVNETFARDDPALFI